LLLGTSRRCRFCRSFSAWPGGHPTAVPSIKSASNSRRAQAMACACFWQRAWRPIPRRHNCWLPPPSDCTCGGACRAGS
jgi:hypothetical protein